jgi:hypothetical protein
VSIAPALLRAYPGIGAVDAPVTIDEIDTAIDECVQCKQTELHVLGWEWEMGLYDLMIPEAKKGCEATPAANSA